MNTEQLQKEKTAQMIWTGFIVMFFVIQAVIWTVAILITSNDASHAVVAGYDKQALHWDDVKRLRQMSNALGWSVGVSVDASGDIRGNRTITVRLNDMQLQPINDATITLNAFHRGRAAEVQTIQFRSQGQGIYNGSVNVQKSGLWQFSGTAMLGGQKLLIEQQIQIHSNRNL